MKQNILNKRNRRHFEYRFFKNDQDQYCFDLTMPNEIRDHIIEVTKTGCDLEIEIMQATIEPRPDGYTYYRIIVTDPMKIAMLKDLVGMMGDNQSSNDN